MEQHTVYLITPGAERVVGQMSYDEDTDNCQVTLAFLTTTLTTTAEDYFAALCNIRQQLETRGILLRCYGASKNVYPSGMGRDMSLGLKAYKLTLGQPAKTSDLVFIFDTDANVIPASVSEQVVFFETWLASLKQGQESQN